MLNWTSGLWTPIVSQVRLVNFCNNMSLNALQQAAIQTIQAMNRAVVQSAGMQTDKPNFTEWAAHPPLGLDDDDDDDDDSIDRL